MVKPVNPKTLVDTSRLPSYVVADENIVADLNCIGQDFASLGNTIFPDGYTELSISRRRIAATGKFRWVIEVWIDNDSVTGSGDTVQDAMSDFLSSVYLTWEYESE